LSNPERDDGQQPSEGRQTVELLMLMTDDLQLWVIEDRN
jgi:hypothetical protein